MPITISAQAAQQEQSKALTSKPTVGIEVAGKINKGLYDISSLTHSAILIIRTSLTIAQVEGNKNRINYATDAVATMEKIDGKDITIQRW